MQHSSYKSSRELVQTDKYIKNYNKFSWQEQVRCWKVLIFQYLELHSFSCLLFQLPYLFKCCVKPWVTPSLLPPTTILSHSSHPVDFCSLLGLLQGCLFVF